MAKAASAAAGIICVTPVNLNFGDVQVKSTKDLTLTVRNAGGGTVSGTAATVAPFFSIFNGGSYDLDPDQSQTVTVRYHPTSPGSHTGTVDFTGGGGATVPVAGKTLSGLPFVPLLLEN